MSLYLRKPLLLSQACNTRMIIHRQFWKIFSSETTAITPEEKKLEYKRQEAVSSKSPVQNVETPISPKPLGQEAKPLGQEVKPLGQEAVPLKKPMSRERIVLPTPPNRMSQEAAKKLSQEGLRQPSSEATVEVPAEGPNQQHIHIGVSNRLPHEFALSLSGCGFLGSYHFGVMICFQKNAKKLMSQVTRIAGASMGSLVATMAILCPDKLEECLALLYECADEVNAMTFGALTPGFYINERVAAIATRFLPEDISPTQNRLYISLTRHKDKMNRIVSTYPDRDYLIKCLLASCFIPIYSMGYYGVAPEIDGEQYIDGGYTENLPNFKDIYTVTISPFSGNAMISPHDQNLFEWKMKLGNQQLKVNMHNIIRGAQALFPPSSKTLHVYYEMGYRDGMRFLLNNGFLERAKGTEV